MNKNISQRSLINIANFNSGVLRDNLVKSPEELEKFNDIKLGIPLLIEADDDLFNFRESDVFHVEPNKLLSMIYDHQIIDYIGFKHSFKNFRFLSQFDIKSHVVDTLKSFEKQNVEVFKFIKLLKFKFKSIGSFQTRNIPHLGHEKIMLTMLEHCQHLVINPIIGPKKKGDIKIEALSKIFNNFVIPKYSKKISFQPILANMFYAGPREAVHHALMRKNLGFSFFSVGRDHAGASGAYQASAASKLLKKINPELGINVMCHTGAKFCRTCNNVVLENECEHSFDTLFDISGSQFRNSIINKKYFDFADKNMQTQLFKIEEDIFEND